jgi:hypothetical protein
MKICYFFKSSYNSGCETDETFIPTGFLGKSGHWCLGAAAHARNRSSGRRRLR